MNHRVGVATVFFALALVGCSGSDSNPKDMGSELGGNSGRGGVGGSGGSQSLGTTSKTGTATPGGSSPSGLGGKSTITDSSGGKRAAGGSTSSSRHTSAGGDLATSGGSEASGGEGSTDGTPNAGGSRTSSTTSAGGATSAGGTAPMGGVSATGRSTKTGGGSSIGGSTSTGGTTATGGSATSGGAGTDSGSTYIPCAASPCKVLPLGDSITHGLQSTDGGGYRSQLFELVVAAKQTLTFLGSQSAGPANVSGVTFPKNHEGYDGYTIDSGFSTYGTPGISSLIPSPAFSTIPDIVLLHIGTNDITSTGSASATASARLDGLLGKIVAAAPKALIVVAQITPVSWTSADLDTYNSKIPGMVQARASQGQHIISVDMSKMPKSALASDGVHPNDQGYAHMASVWYAGIKDYLR